VDEVPHVAGQALPLTGGDLDRDRERGVGPAVAACLVGASSSGSAFPAAGAAIRERGVAGVAELLAIARLGPSGAIGAASDRKVGDPRAQSELLAIARLGTLGRNGSARTTEGAHTANEGLLEEVEAVVALEDDEAALKLVSSWTRLEKIVGTHERLERLANDVAAHYRAGAEQSGGKAMVVAMSQRIAAELTELLRAELGDETVECVISASATDDPAISKWRRSSAERRQVEADFKDPESPLRLVVVRDMWLTGFDVPSLYTLYVESRCATTGCCRRSPG